MPPCAEQLWAPFGLLFNGRFPSGEGQPGGEGDCSAPSTDDS